MKVVSFLLFLSIFFFCISSGCINENVKEETPHPVITNADVMSTPINEEFELTVTVYMQNPMDIDTGSLSVKVKSKDPSTNLITAEKTENVGYLKSGSESYKKLSFNVPESGEQLVMIELFEDGSLIDEYTTQIRLISEVAEPVPNVILTDLMIKTIQATNYGKDIIFEASPGLYNQGEEADKVTVAVTAEVDEYTRYTGSVVVHDLEQNQRKRGTVRMTVPADDSYSFNVDVIVNGEVTSSARTTSSVKLHDLKLENPVTCTLIEAESPVEEEPAEEMPEEEQAEDTAGEQTPGFGLLMLIITLAGAAGIIRRNNRKN